MRHGGSAGALPRIGATAGGVAPAVPERGYSSCIDRPMSSFMISVVPA